VLPRAEFDLDAALSAVRPICDDVHHRGAEALRDLGERFDGVRAAPIAGAGRGPEECSGRARPGCTSSPARDHSTGPHRSPGPAPERHDNSRGTRGVVVERWLPVDRVGLYVPGGVAVYPSSVVMNVVPAQIAGVPSVAVASPPQKDNTEVFAGYPHPTILGCVRAAGYR